MKRKIDQEEIENDANACFENTEYLNKSMNIKKKGPQQSLQLGQTNNNQKRRKQYRKKSNSTVLLNQSWGNYLKFIVVKSVNIKLKNIEFNIR